jgi:hypothetical protein
MALATLTRPALLEAAPVRRRRQWIGALYAAPTAFLVGLFFVVPLLLVAWMSLHHWPLLGPPTLNAPDNAAARSDTGVSLYAFPLTAVRLGSSPFADNVARTQSDCVRPMPVPGGDGGLQHRFPGRLPGELHRPGRGPAGRVGALLHPAQNHGRAARHVSAGRQQSGAASEVSGFYSSGS